MATPQSRIPPSSVETEKALLGAIILENRIMGGCSRSLSADSFFDSRNKRVFEGCLSLWPDGEIDTVSLYDETGVAIMYLNTLADSTFVSHWEQYVRILKDKQNLRAIIAAAQQIATNGYQAGNVEQYATASRESLLDAIQGAGGQAELIRLADGLQDVSRSIIAGEQLTGQIMTGYPCLDDRVGGLSSSLLHVVAGRPSMGKSAFCLNVAINAATAGHKVSYFTLEDAIPYQQRRAISRYSTVDLGDIIQGRVTSDLHHRINEAVGSIEALPLWMSDRGQTVDQIRAAAWSQKSVNGLDLLFIDHLGYVADQGKEYEVVSNATRKFAHLAKELEIPVVLVVQLNRGAEEKENSRPRLKDLRGSGRIEEDARSIWFCYRPGYYWPDDPAHDNVFELIIAKTSHGPTGLAQFYCNLAKMFFRDATGY